MTIDVIIDSSILRSYKSGNPYSQKLIHSCIDEEINIGISSLSLINIWKNEGFDRKSEIGFTSLLDFLTVQDLSTRDAMEIGTYIRSYNQTAITISNRDIEILHTIVLSISSKCDVVTENPLHYTDLGYEYHAIDIQSYLNKAI
jgi:hypothetical protein